MARLTIIIITMLVAQASLLAQSDSIAVPKNERQMKQFIIDGNKKYYDADWEQASNSYLGVLKKDTTNLKAIFNLSNTRYKADAFNETVESFENVAEMLEDKNEKAAAYHNLGNAYFKMEDYQNSIEAYKNALRNNPKDADTRYNLVLAKKKLEEQQQQNQDQQNQDQQNQDQQNEDQNQENQDQQNQEQNGQDENQQDQGNQNEDQQNQGEDNQEQQDQGQQDGEENGEQNGEQGNEQKQGEDGDQQNQSKQGEGNEEGQQQGKQQAVEASKLSKEEVERLLKAIMQDESKVQGKIIKQQLPKDKASKNKSGDKDW